LTPESRDAVTPRSAIGVDIGGNRLIFTGDSANQQLNLW
jgi:hypothetical protein